MRERLKRIGRKFGTLLKNNFFSVIVAAVIFVLAIRLWRLNQIKYNDIIETIKISVTVLISMLGFSVSIYVFLNNTLQNRRNSNELEKEVIDLFQTQKRKRLLISIFFSALAVTAECIVAAFAVPVKNLLSKTPSDLDEFFYFFVIIFLL